MKSVRLRGSSRANLVSDVRVENRPDKDKKTLLHGILRQEPDSIEKHILPLASLDCPHQGEDALSLCAVGKRKRLDRFIGSIGNAEGQHPDIIIWTVPKQMFPAPKTVGINLDVGKQEARHALCEITVINFLRLMQPP